MIFITLFEMRKAHYRTKVAKIDSKSKLQNNKGWNKILKFKDT